MPLVAAIFSRGQLSSSARWHSSATLLIQLPGIGSLLAMTILSAIGEIGRFASAKELVGYSGLGARVYASGEVGRGGGITKQGRAELRTALVEAAWTAVEQAGYWQEEFKRLSRRIDKSKAIVAVARKLLVVVWHVLTKEMVEKGAQAQRIARKLMGWGVDLRAKGRDGLSSKEFVQRGLTRLGLDGELESFEWAGKQIKLAPLELTG